MDKFKKTKVVQIRISEYDKNRLKYLAERYASGSITKWIIHAIKEAPRKYLKKTTVEKNQLISS